MPTVPADHVDPQGQAGRGLGRCPPGALRQGHADGPDPFRSGTKGDFKTLKTVTLHNKRGYFDVHMSFPSSGQVKTEWNGMTSRTQNIKVK